MPDLQNVPRRLDEAIRTTLPNPHYAVNRKRAYYGLPKYGWVIEMAAYHVSVNVAFLGGADFDPQPPLGTTDRTKYVKVTTVAETERPELHRWRCSSSKRVAPRGGSRVRRAYRTTTLERLRSPALSCGISPRSPALPVARCGGAPDTWAGESVRQDLLTGSSRSSNEDSVD